MMAMKAKTFKDVDTLKKIMASDNPKFQKGLGRMVKGFDSEKWNKVAKKIVYDASYAKYTQNKEFKSQLLSTKGTTLVEASPYDKIWGIGLSETDEKAKSRDTWDGLNWLGEVLTKVRQDIIKEDK